MTKTINTSEVKSITEGLDNYISYYSGKANTFSSSNYNVGSNSKISSFLSSIQNSYNDIAGNISNLKRYLNDYVSDVEALEKEMSGGIGTISISGLDSKLSNAKDIKKSKFGDVPFAVNSYGTLVQIGNQIGWINEPTDGSRFYTFTSAKNGKTFTLYYQNDPTSYREGGWNMNGMAGEGCGVTTAAVILSAYDSLITPRTLFDNNWKTGNTIPNFPICELSEGNIQCERILITDRRQNNINLIVKNVLDAKPAYNGGRADNNLWIYKSDNYCYNPDNNEYLDNGTFQKDQFIKDITNELQNGKVVAMYSTGDGVGSGNSFNGGTHYMALLDYNPETNQIFVGNGFEKMYVDNVWVGEPGWYDANRVLSKPSYAAVFSFNSNS